MAEKRVRCSWVKESSPNYVKYHDKEWGVVTRSDRKHFELLCLEGTQAGLSWELILSKREGYRRAFYNFDPKKCASLTETYLEKQLTNPEIVRNRRKIYSVRNNARVFLAIQNEFKSFHRYVWGFVGNKQIVNRLKMGVVRSDNIAEREKLAKDLKKRGMSFVGSKMIYSYMKSVGLVNGHYMECFRYKVCMAS